jgi:SAM-dependent methyltransferase
MKGLKWHVAQFLEKKWWQKYLHRKSPSQYLNWKKDYWRSFLEQVDVPFSRLQGPVLDVGCGPAGVYIILDDYDVTAVDPLIEFYEIHLPVFARDAYPRVRFVTQDFESWETNTSYRTITCFNAINHFHHPDQSLSKIKQIASEETDIYLTIDTHKYILFKWFFQWVPVDALHPHQWDTKDCLRKFDLAGFKVIQMRRLRGNFLFHYDFFHLKSVA